MPTEAHPRRGSRAAEEGAELQACAARHHNPPQTAGGGPDTISILPPQRHKAETEAPQWTHRAEKKTHSGAHRTSRLMLRASSAT